jgi:hypothetical protein
MRTGRCAVQRYASVDEADEALTAAPASVPGALVCGRIVGDADSGNTRREERLVGDAVDLRSLTKTPGE